MALDNVIQAILNEGRKEVSRIIDEGMREKERLMGEASREADRLAEEMRGDALSSVGQLKARELAKAEIQAKRIVLKAQKEVIDNIYALALERLSERSFVGILIKKKSDEIKDSLVYCNEKDREEIEKAIAPLGGKFEGTITCAGGLVIESADRTIMSDYKLESMLKDVWDDSVTEIVALLWGEK
jgi:vacuolar-type H+-ATPase subunit E/Vma4